MAEPQQAARLVPRIGALGGELVVPGDKSISHRSLIFNAVAEGSARISGFLPSADCLGTLRCLEALGVPIRGAGTDWEVSGVGLRGLEEPADVLDVGNSGTTIRLLLGLLAGLDGSAVLTGDASIRRRPMGRVTSPLGQMGMMIDGREEGNRAPLSVRGGAIRAIDWTSPVASAQVKSAILLAGLQAAGRSSVTEPARSRDHSERMLQAMGARIETAGTTVAINGRRPLEAVAVHVPGDLSAAAFWIVAAALLPGSDLVLAHVGLNPTRTGILDALGRMGADITVLDRREVAGEPVGDLRVRHARLHGIDLAGEEVVRAIDEIPILALAMACAEGESCIRDAGELRLKEADRLTGIQEVLGGLGARIRVAGDRLEVAGMTRWRGGEVDCLKDHRLAMMAAIAAQLASDEVRIVGAEATDTSYPTFWEHLGRFSG